jgi:hypothetical protein
MNNSVTNNIPQETINSVLVDILKGAKDAGREIYGASKTGIVKAVDFAQEQAPLVVQEFLTWKFAQATIWTVVSVIGLIVLGYIIKKCYDWLEESSGGSIVGVIFGKVFFVMVVFMGLIPNVEQMVKVKVAPRVYIIEWVSDQVNPPKHNNR